MEFRESETVELKKSTSELKEAVISIVSILNKHGKGKLYFGITDDGKIIGQHIGKSTIKDISKSIADYTDPKIYPDIKTQKISGKDCIVVEFIGHEGLYSAYGRFYLRSGEEDKKLSVMEIARLIEKNKNYVYPWGEEVFEKPVSAVKTLTLRSFVKRGKEAGRIGFSFDSSKNVLCKLNLVKGNRLLNAGWALFCNNNGTELQTAVFAGIDKLTFLDIQSFRGNLYELIEKGETYVKEHINWRADLSGSRRIEIPEIPVRAIREAIINSLCHRDFANPKSNKIAIYRNRIEIYNPGQFPHEYSPQDFIKGNKPSIPLNHLIAETLYRSKDIEKWGSGLRRISEECKREGVKVDFRKIKSGFLVIFYRPNLAKQLHESKITEAVPGKVTVKVPEKVTENQRKILENVSQNMRITIAELAKIVGISERKIKENISKLKSKQLIRRIGPDKGGYWEANNKTGRDKS